MMFSNLTLYHIYLKDDSLEAALARRAFTPCALTQQLSVGWVPPRGEQHGAMVEIVNGQRIIRLAIETKTVPGEALRKRAEALAEQFERDTGRKPGRLELRDLREDALQELLPHAFPRRADVMGWIDPDTDLLAIDTASPGVADRFVTAMVDAAGQSLALGILNTARSPQSAMTSWLSGEAPPNELLIGLECELRGAGENPASVRFANHDLATDEVRRHIAEGKLPTRLELVWSDRASFVLTREFRLKKITFMDARDELIEGVDDRFDADVVLATGELAPLIQDLVGALGGRAVGDDDE